MPRRPLRAALLAAALGAVALRFLAGSGPAPAAFVPPPPRTGAGGESAAAMAAAIMAASVAAAPPAMAAGAKFGFFGLGDGISDAYNQLDNNAYSPYSSYSQGASTDFADKAIMDKKKVALRESFKRLETVPDLLSQKESEEVKKLLTLQLYTMRSNMEYISGGGPPFYRDEKTPAFAISRNFFQSVADLGVANRNKKWGEATTDYNRAMSLLNDWKRAVSFD